MYTKICVGILVFVLVLAPLAMANPFNAVKKAVKDVGKTVTGDTAPTASGGNADKADASGAASATGGGSAARPGVKQHDKYPPGVSFSTMLNGVSYLPDKGQLRLEQIQATFISSDSKGYIILRKDDGTELLKWDWEVDNFRDMKPYYLLNMMSTTDMRTGTTDNRGWVDLKEPGNYVLDFYLPDEHFYTFPSTKVNGSA